MLVIRRLASKTNEIVRFGAMADATGLGAMGVMVPCRAIFFLPEFPTG